MSVNDQRDVVFALDIGVYKTGSSGQVLARTTAGWSRLTRGVIDFASLEHRGNPTSGYFVNSSDPRELLIAVCGRSIEKLAELIAQDLKAGRRVALGIEAPMWIPLENHHQANMSLFMPRFSAEQRSEWYLQSGAAATIKAISLGVMLREHLHEVVERSRYAAENPKSVYTPSLPNSGHYLNRRIHHGPSRHEPIQ